MLGLGASLSLPAIEEPYKELSELNNYSDLDVHFDFSVLPDAHGTEITAATNLATGAGTPSNYNITSNTGTPLLDRSTMSLPSMAFDGSDEVLNMTAAYTTTGKAFTFFIVMQRGDVTNDYTVASATAGGSPSVPDDYIRFMTSGTVVHLALQNQTVVGITTNNTNPSSSTINYTAVEDVNMVYVINRNATGEVAIYSDNGLYIAFKDNGPMKAGATLEIGHIGGTEAGDLADLTGNIGEVGLYDADIGAANSIILAEELSKKWGITRTS